MSPYDPLTHSNQPQLTIWRVVAQNDAKCVLLAFLKKKNPKRSGPGSGFIKNPTRNLVWNWTRTRPSYFKITKNPFYIYIYRERERYKQTITLVSAHASQHSQPHSLSLTPHSHTALSPSLSNIAGPISLPLTAGLIFTSLKFFFLSPHSGDGASPGFVSFSLLICCLVSEKIGGKNRSLMPNFESFSDFLSGFWSVFCGVSPTFCDIRLYFCETQEDLHWRIAQRDKLW